MEWESGGRGDRANGAKKEKKWWGGAVLSGYCPALVSLCPVSSPWSAHKARCAMEKGPGCKSLSMVTLSLQPISAFFFLNFLKIIYLRQREGSRHGGMRIERIERERESFDHAWKATSRIPALDPLSAIFQGVY